MSLQEIYKEITFQLEPLPTNTIKLSIILAHAINIHKGFKHNGLREEDAQNEWQTLATGWDQDDQVQGIYSLRYENQKKDTIQFKFVTQNEWISIHAINTNDETNLYSFQVLSPEFQNPQSKFIDQYEKEIIIPLNRSSQQQKEQNKSNLIEVEPQKPQGFFWKKPRADPQCNTGQAPFGRNDLDPFGNPFGSPFGNQTNPFNNPMGGNLLGPQSFGQQPPQQPPRIPGARFDPFGPDPNFNGNFWDNNRRGGNGGNMFG